MSRWHEASPRAPPAGPRRPGRARPWRGLGPAARGQHPGQGRPVHQLHHQVRRDCGAVLARSRRPARCPDGTPTRRACPGPEPGQAPPGAGCIPARSSLTATGLLSTRSVARQTRPPRRGPPALQAVARRQERRWLGSQPPDPTRHVASQTPGRRSSRVRIPGSAAPRAPGGCPPPTGGRPSLPKMLATCFSTAPPETTRAAAIPALDRPSAISASTSRSRGVSVARSPACRLARTSWLTTSGSSAVPPARHPGQRVGELGHVGDPVLEQVADA